MAKRCRTAVDRQIEYGRELGLPWGISESGFSAQYLDGDYQYQAFGVPGLGLKRGLANDLVVAPYATALAATMNISSVTRIASVANTAMPMAGKM